MQGVHAEPAETAHFLLVLYVKPLELEFDFGFFRHKRIKGLRARLRETEVSRLFINRTTSVPGSLLVLVLSDLIYYPLMNYPSKFVCKSCRFVRDWRNSIYYPILCIIRTRIKQTRPVHEPSSLCALKYCR